MQQLSALVVVVAVVVVVVVVQHRIDKIRLKAEQESHQSTTHTHQPLQQ